MSVIQSNGSVTHTFGNVSCVAMDYIKKYFKEDFFKRTHISTKLAYKQLNTFRTNEEFWKLHKPLLILRPRIEINDDAKWFFGTAKMNRMYNARNPMEFTSRVELLKDPEKGVLLEFMWNRAKIYYDVVIALNSYNEQLNIAHYLHNMIVPNTPFFINTALESFVPKNTIYTIADYLGIDRDNTAAILQYLNTYGNTPFTYKFKDGSGNDEFFSLYGTNIEAIVSEIDTDEGVEKGMTTDNFTISFTLSMEFNMMGSYFLTLFDKKDTFITCPPDTDIGKADAIVPLLTVPLYEGLPDIPEGWKIVYAPSFLITDPNKDITDISAVFDSALKEVIKYQRSLHLDLDLFVRFRVFAGYKELPYGERGYELDLRDLNHPKLITYNGKPNMTYRIFVIVNNSYIHSITSDIAAFNTEK